jgi:magnesium-transporting ATPase (P-type)
MEGMSLLTQDRSGNRQKNAMPVLVRASAGPLDALYSQLQTSPDGLTTEEARKRLGQYGPNEPAVVRRAATLQQLLVFVANPLVLILLFASIITAMLGEVQQ